MLLTSSPWPQIHGVRPLLAISQPLDKCSTMRLIHTKPSKVERAHLRVDDLPLATITAPRLSPSPHLIGHKYHSFFGETPPSVNVQWPSSRSQCASPSEDNFDVP